ncbi:MAG: ATP-dependent sacrificial sulfur transferase LarE [Methanothrix sp.]|nr:ATP-dependent sacrificial sulfur transferase LarE [Methanothrix sp.]MCX8207159.1 ATP-dependent sacrificial sulfur transferase LarE [Methanothrix sp.]
MSGVADKLDLLRKIIASKESMLVSFSGGVDSSLLAAISRDVLGDRAVAAILDSPLMPRRELEHAKSVAEHLGIKCIVVEHDILDLESVVENRPDRCYHCKRASAEILRKIASSLDISCVADGVNTTDYDDYRPGIKACDEEGICHPFVDAGISKYDIREIARSLRLDFWSRPSSACLASRIPYGMRITSHALKRVELAEDMLKDIGLSQLRVRAHGDLARIEVLESEIQEVLMHRESIVNALKDLGFSYITLDLEGYRSGSMNESMGIRKDISDQDISTYMD